jgi:hypothetical protein
VPVELESALGISPVYWSDLSSKIWDRTKSEPRQLGLSVLKAFRLAMHTGDGWAAIAGLPVVGLPIPSNLQVRELPFTVRTINGLCDQAKLESVADAAFLAVAEFMDIRNLGVVSLFDFGCTTEAALAIAGLDRTESPATPPIHAVWRKYNEEVWAGRIYSRDPRFKSLLGGRLDVPLYRLPVWLPAARAAAAEKALQEAQPVVEAITNSRLRPQLADYFRALIGDRRFESTGPGLMARFGLSGELPCTLQEAGDRSGLTRERIRQLEIKYLKLQKDAVLRPFMPALEKALELLAEWAPVSSPTAERWLVKARVTSGHFAIESVLAAAEFLGFAPSIALLETAGSDIVVSVTDPGQKALVRRAVLRIQARARRGVANVPEIEADLGAQTKVGTGLVASVLTALPGIHVRGEWFWDLESGGDGRNKIVNLTNKMLSVNSPMSLQTLREGIRRHERGRDRSSPPPLAVLEAFYRSRPAYAVDQLGRISMTTALPTWSHVSPAERQMVEILRRAPDALMDRNSLVEACYAAGMNLATVTQFTSYNPCLERIAPNVWAPRGTHVSPAVLAEFRRLHGWRNAPTNDVETGWDAEGHPWWAFEVTASLLAASGASTIPSAIRPVLGRDYQCFTEGGEPCGVLHANGDSPFVWGWSRFFSVASVDAGDYVRATFDIGDRKAVLEVGGSELLESPVDDQVR